MCGYFFLGPTDQNREYKKPSKAPEKKLYPIATTEQNTAYTNKMTSSKRLEHRLPGFKLVFIKTMASHTGNFTRLFNAFAFITRFIPTHQRQTKLVICFEKCRPNINGTKEARFKFVIIVAMAVESIK